MMVGEGSQTVTHLPGLDEVTVGGYLRDRFGASDVAEIAGGAWSQAFAMTVDGGCLVIRFGGDLVEYDKDRLAASWSRRCLPVPEVLDAGEAFGRHWVVSEYVAGRMLDTLDVAGWEAVLPSLVAALDAMRRVEMPGIGYGRFDGAGNASYPTWSSWLLANLDGAGEHRIVGWRSGMSATPGAVARYEADRERFVAAAAWCPEVRRATHTDLPGNTIVNGGRVNGVIDWGNAVAGDPLYDVANLLFWAPWHPGCPEKELRRAVVEVFGGEDRFDERVYAYELHVALGAMRYDAARGRPRLFGPLAERVDALAAG